MQTGIRWIDRLEGGSTKNKHARHHRKSCCEGGQSRGSHTRTAGRVGKASTTGGATLMRQSRVCGRLAEGGWLMSRQIQQQPRKTVNKRKVKIQNSGFGLRKVSWKPRPRRPCFVSRTRRYHHYSNLRAAEAPRRVFWLGSKAGLSEWIRTYIRNLKTWKTEIKGRGTSIYRFCLCESSIKAGKKEKKSCPRRTEGCGGGPNQLETHDA